MSKQSIYRSRTEAFPLKTNFLFFYIFIGLPIGFVLNGLYFLSYLISSSTGLYFDKNILTVSMIITLAELVFGIIVFKKLKNLEESGYTYNMALLIANTFICSILGNLNSSSLVEFGYRFLLVLMIGAVCFLPYYIYFRKRKSLFSENFELKYVAP